MRSRWCERNYDVLHVLRGFAVMRFSAWIQILSESRLPKHYLINAHVLPAVKRLRVASLLSRRSLLILENSNQGCEFGAGRECWHSRPVQRLCCVHTLQILLIYLSSLCFCPCRHVNGRYWLDFWDQLCCTVWIFDSCCCVTSGLHRRRRADGDDTKEIWPKEMNTKPSVTMVSCGVRSVPLEYFDTDARKLILGKKCFIEAGSG